MNKDEVFFLGIGDNDKGQNPYINLLAASLSTREVAVNLTKGWDLTKYMLSSNYDRNARPIVHLHWIQRFYLSSNPLISLTKIYLLKGYLKWLRSKARGIIWTAHNVYNHERKWLGLEGIAANMLLQIADRIIVHGESAKEEFQKRLKVYNDSIFRVIPHGNYIGYYENTISRNQARRQLGIDMEAIVFLFFGMIRRYKGIQELIQGFSRFSCGRCCLIIAGFPHDAELAREIHKLSCEDKRIKLFIGSIPEEHVQVFFNASDLMILPYRDILTSGSAMLSLSFGLPVLSPSVGHLKEIIEYGAGHPIYDVSPDGLAKSIYESLELDLTTMRNRALNFAQQYPWEMVAKLTKEVYSELPSK